MTDISLYMDDFCKAGAYAVSRYVAVTGEGPSSMPEYFMSSMILERTADNLTSVLEANYGTLRKWNLATRQRDGLSSTDAHQESQFEDHLLSRRVDMALFQHNDNSDDKSIERFIALVEIKRGYIDASREDGRYSDRDKLLMILHQIDTCPWGIVAGWTNQEHADWQLSVSMMGTDDQWFQAPIDMPAGTGRTLVFGARVFRRGADAERLEHLRTIVPAAGPA